MKVKLLTSIAGQNFSYSYGEETDKLDPEDAKRLIERGLAIEIKEEPKKARAKK